MNESPSSAVASETPAVATRSSKTTADLLRECVEIGIQQVLTKLGDEDDGTTKTASA